MQLLVHQKQATQLTLKAYAGANDFLCDSLDADGEALGDGGGLPLAERRRESGPGVPSVLARRSRLHAD